MAIQLSTAVRNARLDAIETTIGVSALLRLYTGAAPANTAASETGTKLVEYALASNWASDAASGSKALSGLPLTVNAIAGGDAAHYRIYNSGGTTCHLQGTVTAAGGGGDAIIDVGTVGSTTLVSGQPVNVTSATWTDANA